MNVGIKGANWERSERMRTVGERDLEEIKVNEEKTEGVKTVWATWPHSHHF